MTDALTLGANPEPLQVVLVDGADFRCDLVLSVDWPDGMTVALNVGGSTWNATVTADTASFHEAAAVTDAIAAGTEAQLIVTDTGGPQVWAKGKVFRG